MKNTVALVILALSLMGCDRIDNLEKQLAEANRNIAEITRVADANMQRAVRAVPGERLLQIYDGLFSEDPGLRERTQDLLRRMASSEGELLGGDWAVSLEAQYEGGLSRPIEADIIWVPVSHEFYVQTHVEKNGFQGSQLGPGTGLRYRPALVREDVEPIVDAQLKELFDAIAGLPGGYDRRRSALPNQAIATWVPTSSLLPNIVERRVLQSQFVTPEWWDGPFVVNPASFEASVEAQRRRFQRLLGDAILAGQPGIDTVTVLRMAQPVSETLENNTACVLIPSATWGQLDGSKLSLFAYVHDRSDPQVLHPYSVRTRIPNLRFDTSKEYFPPERGEGGYKWACQVVLDYGYNRKILSILQGQKELDAALNSPDSNSG